MSYVDGEGYKEITAAIAFRSHNTSFDCAVMVLKKSIECASLRCGREKKIGCGNIEGEKVGALDIGEMVFFS